jgi:hypothetical protein
MAIDAIKIKSPHVARHTGAAAGLAAGSAYIIKNRKDIFIEGGKKVAEALGHSKAVGIAVPAAISASIIATATLAGTLIGAGIDKIRNNIMQKKAVNAVKSMIAEQIEKNIKDKKPVDLDELIKEQGIDLEG